MTPDELEVTTAILPLLQVSLAYWDHQERPSSALAHSRVHRLAIRGCEGAV